MKKTILGLSLSLAVPAIYVLFISPIIIKSIVDEPVSTLVDFGVLWGLACGVLIFTRNVEKLPLTTIGWKPLSWKLALTAIGLGILLSLLVPVLTLLVSTIFPPFDTGTVTQVVSHFSWWIIAAQRTHSGYN